MNNQLVEGKYGHGARITPHNPEVARFADIAKDTAPFDWNAGFDVRKVLLEKAGISDVPTKDQGISGACGGIMMSYLAQILIAIFTGIFEEKSAKFVYAPVAYPDFGGSSEEDLIRRVMNVGISSEKLCPSYDNGQPPTEAFMARASDITPEAVMNALKSHGFTQAYVDLESIDELACAIRDHFGIGSGISAMNNGTWASQFPVAPTLPPRDPGLWAHWEYYGRAHLVNGVKKIFAKNGWGDAVGDHGWQGVGEEFLPYMFAPFALVFTGLVEGFTYTFTQDLRLGNVGDEVSALQMALKLSGDYPKEQALTGYFGQVTYAAVKSFQTKHAAEILTPAGLTLPTGIVGANTRKVLNGLYFTKEV
jgi:hypothetical protein